MSAWIGVMRMEQRAKAEKQEWCTDRARPSFHHTQVSGKVNTDFSHLGLMSSRRITDTAKHGFTPTPRSARWLCVHQPTTPTALSGLSPKYCNKTHLTCSSNSFVCSVLRNTLSEALCIWSVYASRDTSPEEAQMCPCVWGRQDPPELRYRRVYSTTSLETRRGEECHCSSWFGHE